MNDVVLDTARVTPVHVAVRGRARLRVAGLRGSSTAKSTIEASLRRAAGVATATANPTTGNVLVEFDGQLPLSAIIGQVELAIGQGGAGARAKPDGADWHRIGKARVIERSGSSPAGLSSEAARDRLARHGRNELPRLAGRSLGDIALGQVCNLPIALLAGAALLSLATGGIIDALAIAGVVAVNAAIGTITEAQTERAIGALAVRGSGGAPVFRDGHVRRVPIEEVVPGDMLDLRPGTIVAADARVIEARELSVNESMLTGESAPVLKIGTRLAAEVPLADRANMVYRGTNVTGGSGRAIAVATGESTEIGYIQALAGTATRPQTPLQRQLDTLGRQLVWLSAGVCGLVFFTGLIRGYGLLQMAKSSASLAVAAVPEGLPALATTTLALGIERLRRRRVLVRHIKAIEALAAVKVICLDKTGTLTLNRMSVAALFCARKPYRAGDGGAICDAEGFAIDPSSSPDLAKLLELGALCNDTIVTPGAQGYELSGSPTEAALVRRALDSGIDVLALRGAHPTEAADYRTERRLFMTTLHQLDDQRNLAAVKGSPREVLALCRWYLRDGEAVLLTEAERHEFARENARMAEDGLRVLAVAFATKEGSGTAAVAPGLTWVGLVGLADPTRRGMADLISTFHDAGIATMMITGDQSATASAIARELNLGNGEHIRIVEPAEIDRDEEIEDLTKAAHVYARVTPAQKLRIVQALQRSDRVVAMTGDGINDSPALKAADIGVAMGIGGTEAAREVADIVLQDDDLMVLPDAIAHGRTTYGNIRKAIRFLLATNLSEVMVMLAATTAGLGQPLTPIQLLWVNLLSDALPAIGLGLEPPEPDVLKRPPRDPRELIVGRADYGALAREAATISAGALGGYAWGLARHGAGPQARTISFAGLVTAQMLHALTSRSSDHGLFMREGSPRNPTLTATLVLSFLAQGAAMLVPGIRNLLGLAALDAADALVTLAAGTVPYLVNEAMKAKQGQSPRGGGLRA